MSFDRKLDARKLSNYRSFSGIRIIWDIPFIGTVAGVTVGYVDGQCVLSPTAEQLENGAIYLSVAGTKDAITMVEAGAKRSFRRNHVRSNNVWSW